MISTEKHSQMIVTTENNSFHLFHNFIHIFAFRLVLVKLITAPQPQQSRSGIVRMDPRKRDHLLSHLMVPYGQKVSEKKITNHPFHTIQYVTMQWMPFILFILFSLLIDFLRKCAQMSSRLESPASLCARRRIFCGRVHALHRSVVWKKD